jgi:hypothetical protein
MHLVWTTMATWEGSTVELQKARQVVNVIEETSRSKIGS